ncbi:MAG TPA: hypothetical protein DEF34_10225 [Desulfotomaculum sp.]|nr:MAG: hypothetical protein JL56_05830 [Desulfotomaculum sp. BICA1-6]HBX23990.1 hypothetical protein [Desulfotomaculum sp.]
MVNLVQLAEAVVTRDLLGEVEQELENYKFYRDFLELSTSHQLSISNLTTKRLSTVRVIDSACGKLPPHLREFIKYRYFEGLTMENVAEKMNLSTSACYKYRRQVLHKFGIVLGKL